MTELFSSLLSGMRSTDRFLGDLDGDNIHDDNPHSEMRHQYYVWKNLLGQYDAVGFEHYRRVFFVDVWPMATLRSFSPELLELRRSFHQDIRRASLDVPPAVFDRYWTMRHEFGPDDRDLIRRDLGGYDVVLPRSVHPGNIMRQWGSCLPQSIWHGMIHAAMASRFGRRTGFIEKIMIEVPSYNNMCIMRSEHFDEYMEFYFDTIDELKRTTRVAPRLWGHCAERLLNIYVCARQLNRPTFRVGYMPFLFKTDEHAKPIGDQSPDATPYTAPTSPPPLPSVPPPSIATEPSRPRFSA